MKVYVLMGLTDYESSDAVGVFKHHPTNKEIFAHKLPVDNGYDSMKDYDDFEVLELDLID